MKRLAATWLVLVWCSGAWGMGATYSLLDLAQQSDLVITGTVTQVDDKTATIQIDKVVAGKYAAATIVVTPITMSTDVGQYVNIKKGEAVLLFARQNGEGMPATVVGGGQGKLTLEAATREELVTAAARLMEIAALKEEDAVNRAMIGEAAGRNARLRDAAYLYLSLKLKGAEKYKKELLGLLGSSEPVTQRAGLNALRFVDAPEAIPRLIELTRSADAGVVDSASMTLGRYTTTEATAALVVLTQSPDLRIRQRATLDLGNNHHDTAKPALAAKLDDKDAKVRAIAPTGLVYLLRDGKADDLIPKIAGLLKDPDEDVATSAARALGETRNPEAVEPLLEVLQWENLSRNLQYFTLQALYSHYTKDKQRAKEMIDKRMGTIIAALKDDKGTSGFGPAFQAVGILGSCNLPEAKAALQWAAESHPNAEIKDYAKRSLDRRSP